ncbi:DUF1614 domain-containing protein [Clostridium sp. 'deep sea']|uniref:DUF1614 domain-containing protein n=1 Tax=Clostridium sp. 'deep sea' TaxID=2779445 RepID=UPI00189650E9|nr:DUF1614 domain-containing protein [Clostridium sp. 'deep sea']QOR36918.1 DUF1614 domain-containing protein [Clostridium sp. 'deep sea']
MPIGLIALVVLSILIFFGIGQRALDRLYLNDKMALLVIALMFVGTFIPNIPITAGIAVNIGGALIPLLLGIYILYRIDTTKERWRALIAIVVTSLAVYLASRYLPAETETMIIEPNYLYALIAGVVAYITGRSRRSAFVAGVFSIIINDIIYAFEIYRQGLESKVVLGGAGVFDATVLAGILGVLLAELIGETRERMRVNKEHKIEKAHSASTLASLDNVKEDENEETN